MQYVSIAFYYAYILLCDCVFLHWISKYFIILYQVYLKRYLIIRKENTLNNTLNYKKMILDNNIIQSYCFLNATPAQQMRY